MSDAPIQPYYCANHPNVETTLRCNSCEKPICPKCAVLTPTGYRCRDCVRGRQKVFDTAKGIDYPLGMLPAAVLAFLGNLLSAPMGFLSIFLAPVIGVIIAEVVRFLVRRRRSRLLTQLCAGAVAVGALLVVLYTLFTWLISGYFSIWTLVWQVAYIFIVTSTVYYRLGGIQVK